MFAIVGGELDMEDAVPLGTLYLSSQKQDGTTTVTVTGEVDIATASQLRDYAEEALRPAPRRLVIDMGGVSFFAAAGISVLSALADSAAGHGTELLLGEVSPAVTRVLLAVGALPGQPAGSRTWQPPGSRPGGPAATRPGRPPATS